MAPEQTNLNKPELPKNVEASIEQSDATEIQQERGADETENPPVDIVLQTPVPPPPQPLKKDPIQIDVEAVLSENLAEFYKSLPADKKTEFKNRGEEVANQVVGMIRSGIMQVKRVLEMIRSWLKLIPGVNNFFLEQEAKLKMDKIKALYDREHDRTLWFYNCSLIIVQIP